MADAFLNLAIFGNIGGQSITGGLLGGIFRAEGGPVKAGGSYIVGERGPEMFVPNSGGRIVPNSNIGGSTNVVVNVDASGSSVEGDEKRGRELGVLISAAIQSELINQKRPGGLLS
jgi:phage-related minor tail protein